MVKEYMDRRKPMILVFAGPNGSGKSTITEEFKRLAPLPGTYVNADIIKQERECTDLEAAQFAELERNEVIDAGKDLTFETVLSTRRNLDLLIRARGKGYFIKAFYIITASPEINVARVQDRVFYGGHEVPEDKIISRYHKAIKLIPELISVCDVIHIYDNSGEKPERIFKKKRDEIHYYPNEFWNENKIKALVRNYNMS